MLAAQQNRETLGSEEGVLAERGRYVRALSDVVLIVAGVLLAFGVESRWQAFKDARQQSAYLSGVVDELEQNRESFKGALELNVDWSRAADSLVAIALESTPVPDSILSDLLWRTTSYGSFRPSTVALESLVSSTAWADLDDPALRTRLAELEATLQWVQDGYEERNDFWFESFEPYLRKRINYEAWSDRRAAPGVDWGALLEDREFQNLVVHSEWFTGTDASRLNEVIRQVSAVLELLPVGRGR